MLLPASRVSTSASLHPHLREATSITPVCSRSIYLCINLPAPLALHEALLAPPLTTHERHLVREMLLPASRVRRSTAAPRTSHCEGYQHHHCLQQIHLVFCLSTHGNAQAPHDTIPGQYQRHLPDEGPPA